VEVAVVVEVEVVVGAGVAGVWVATEPHPARRVAATAARVGRPSDGRQRFRWDDIAG